MHIIDYNPIATHSFFFFVNFGNSLILFNTCFKKYFRVLLLLFHGSVYDQIKIRSQQIEIKKRKNNDKSTLNNDNLLFILLRQV